MGEAVADWPADVQWHETRQAGTRRVPRTASGLVLLEQRAMWVVKGQEPARRGPGASQRQWAGIGGIEAEW